MSAAQFKRLLAMKPSGDTMKRWLRSLQAAKAAHRAAALKADVRPCPPFDFDTWVEGLS